MTCAINKVKVVEMPWSRGILLMFTMARSVIKVGCVALQVSLQEHRRE